jgi:hypothetical protein
MRDHNHTAVQETQGDEAGFTLVISVVQYGDRRAGKDPLNPYEVDPVLLNVGSPLGFIPFKKHIPMVATSCSYVNWRAKVPACRVGRFAERASRSVVRRQPPVVPWAG